MPCYRQGGGLCLLFCVILCKRGACQVHKVGPRQREGLAVVTHNNRSSQWLGHHHGVRVMLTICGADATVQGQRLFFMYGSNHRPFLGDAPANQGGGYFLHRQQRRSSSIWHASLSAESGVVSSASAAPHPGHSQLSRTRWPASSVLTAMPSPAIPCSPTDDSQPWHCLHADSTSTGHWLLSSA